MLSTHMKKLNVLVLNITVAIIDFLYRGRDFQRFWVLEEIARAPYFAFLSVLHFRESLGLRGQWHLYLMKEHFEQSVNETEHLEYMESRDGSRYWIDRFVARHLVLIYYWINVVYYWLDPLSAYHLSEEIELHAAETYAEYLTRFPKDEKIWEIMNDEIQHWQELREAARIIHPDHLTVREKDAEPFPPDLSDLEVTTEIIGYQEHEPIS
jgi:ubiquinol oxidase